MELLKMITGKLGITWASILATLPTQRDVDLGANTAAGRQFRSEMIRLWTTPHTWEIPKNGDGTASEHISATKASLVSRVQSQFRRWQRAGSVIVKKQAWRHIHPALSGWWRVGEVDGELRVYLAMRWELASQVRQELTAVTDQDSLTDLGKKFRVLAKDPVVADRTPGSKGDERQLRLAILSDDLTDELLSNPAEDFDGEPDTDG
jgi:hypothetical protein